MFSAFRMGPAPSERGLCDIDRVLFRVTLNQVSKNFKVFERRIILLDRARKNMPTRIEKCYL